ncbi:hypothetical protein F3B51_07185 [Bacteroides ovatus]|uniref:Uncharacterized protein n=1 Tax=Bacteroides ovatus TaxID=28116 RepID=A0A5N4EXX4_BACOV|nr:hypothetical protein F3B68_01925 [Bacteroides ovatus]KAA4570345.1 hypothetical protein F3C56_03785 [Bacteroides ovatus]KAA4572266.1 hypothetical protein F3B65_07045 [Bacteroides ovatus]KAA4581198.1 hypothetical protein F3B64_07560 [Bacteroides ovatus]KAA4583687.1 hypothetical protein F3C21_05950 [Bacteroides ovatus]
MSGTEFLFILAFGIVIISGLVAVKLKYDNRKKWWLPLAFGGGIAVIIIAFIIWVIIDFMSTPLCV